MTLAHSLPLIRPIHRAGPVLHPTPIAGNAEVLGLHVPRGCVDRCVFCSARAYPNGPGDTLVEVDPDLTFRLEQELARRRPHAVFISPSTDPFPPINEVQQ